MSLEGQIFAAVGPLAGNRVFPDFAPNDTARPYIVYQAVGGTAVNYVEGGPVGTRNARVQVTVWADTRLQASQIGDQVEDTIRGIAGLQPEVLGAAMSMFDEDTKLRGRLQEFSFWY